jgi:hypothetical protein
MPLPQPSMHGKLVYVCYACFGIPREWVGVKEGVNAGTRGVFPSFPTRPAFFLPNFPSFLRCYWEATRGVCPSFPPCPAFSLPFLPSLDATAAGRGWRLLWKWWSIVNGENSVPACAPSHMQSLARLGVGSVESERYCLLVVVVQEGKASRG